MKVGLIRPREIEGRSYDSISDEMEHKKRVEQENSKSG